MGADRVARKLAVQPTVTAPPKRTLRPQAGSAALGGQRTLDRAAFEGDKSGVYSIKGEIDERSYGAKRHARAVSVPGLRSSRRAHRR
ncbi:MAG: hypothetical protein ACLPSW_06985 [Roseiarcus sp.]